MFWDATQLNRALSQAKGECVQGEKIPDNLSAPVMFNSASVYSSAEPVWHKNLLENFFSHRLQPLLAEL